MIFDPQTPVNPPQTLRTCRGWIVNLFAAFQRVRDASQAALGLGTAPFSRGVPECQAESPTGETYREGSKPTKTGILRFPDRKFFKHIFFLDEKSKNQKTARVDFRNTLACEDPKFASPNSPGRPQTKLAKILSPKFSGNAWIIRKPKQNTSKIRLQNQDFEISRPKIFQKSNFLSTHFSLISFGAVRGSQGLQI